MPTNVDISSGDDIICRLARFLLSKFPFRLRMSSQWRFTSWQSPVHESGSARLERQHALLNRMKIAWRQEVVEVPHTWLLTEMRNQHIQGNIAHMNLGVALNHCTVSQMSTDAALDRHNATDCVAPDFCLTKQRIGCHPSNCYSLDVDVKLGPPKRLEDLFQNCTQTASDVMMYDRDEQLAGFAVSGIFIGIPGCSMTRNTRTCLPPSLMPNSTMDDLQRLDFSVLAHPVGSSSPESLSRDKALYISVKRPALLLGMKGPMGWGTGRTSGKSLQELIADMSVHAEASLDIINQEWHDYHGDSSSLCPPLPDEAIIFGVIYDASQLHIIAHMLEEDSPRHYVSYLVDSLEFPADPNGHGSAQWFTGRLRVLVALLTLQRHVHRLGSLWGETACSSSSDVFLLSKRINESEINPEEEAPGYVVSGTYTVSLSDVLDDFVMGPDPRRPYEPSDKSPTVEVAQEDEDEEEDDEDDEDEDEEDEEDEEMEMERKMEATDPGLDSACGRTPCIR